MAYSLDFVKKHYNMPFLQRGMKIIVNGKAGKVTSGDDKYIRVRYDNATSSRRCHAQWEAVYFDKDGNIIADYRAAKEGR